MNRKTLFCIAASLLLALGVACSGGAPTTAPPTNTPAPQPTAAPTATPPPAAAATTPTATAAAPTGPPTTPVLVVEEDELHGAAGGRLVQLFSDPPSLDPHLVTDATSSRIIVEVFGGLTTINLDNEVVLDLAESVDISADGRVYTFRLHPEAKFHDGRAVTAADVQWSLERAANPLTESPVAGQYLGDIVGVNEKLDGDAQSIAGLRVVDDRTIELTIDQPKSYFLAKLTYPTAFVLDRNNVEGDPRNWFREPNGTGPFRMTEYRVGETLVLERNEHYHLGEVRLEAVELILSGGTSMLMYENDEIHISGVGLADLDRLLDPSSELHGQLVRAEPSFTVQYIGLNVNEPPLDDVKVRQALNLAVDKSEIASVVLGDLVVPADGILPPNFPGYNPEVSGYDFDPERARALLAESKYGDDLDNLPPITITTPGSFGANVSLDMEVVLRMWETNLGITAEFQQTEFATFLKDLHKRRFQMFDIGWIADYPDPENFLDVLFHSASDNNHTNYSNPEVDRLLEQARVETDQARRYALYNEAEQIILDEAPWVPLWYSGESYVLVKPEVQDYHLPPLIIPRLRYVWLSEG